MRLWIGYYIDVAGWVGLLGRWVRGHDRLRKIGLLREKIQYHVDDVYAPLPPTKGLVYVQGIIRAREIALKEFRERGMACGGQVNAV